MKICPGGAELFYAEGRMDGPIHTADISSEYIAYSVRMVEK